MSLRQFLSTSRDDGADRSSLENDRTPTYTSNVTTAPTHNLPGRDSMRLPDETTGKSSLTDKLELMVADPNYVFYRIYAEDGAIPSRTPVPGDPFLGRIKAISVPPPHTANAVKRSIAKVENIKDRTSTSLFLTPYSQSPVGDSDKIAIRNRAGPGSTPQEPLAVVAKMSDSERSAFESEGRDGLASDAYYPDTMTPDIRYLYYLLYADDDEMASKVAIDPQRLSLGRIRADSVTPPHSPASIKRCISRVERTPELAHADLFVDISSDTPLKEGHISILRTDGPGLSPNEPMAIVQMSRVESPPIPDGKYVIKNRAAEIYWTVWDSPMTSVRFWSIAMQIVGTRRVRGITECQWDITHHANGNISMRSLYAPSSWVGAELSTASTVPVPWRLIPAGSKFYYLTSDFSQNPRVPTARPCRFDNETFPGSMATRKEGDRWQMWEFIRI